MLNLNDATPPGSSSVVDIDGTEPRLYVQPGRFQPCPAKFCAVGGCDATMDLVLSHEEYPYGDPAHTLEWPHLYRRWVCRRDKTHFVNVSADEWQAVQRFARERTAEERAERGEPSLLGTILGLVFLVPAALVLGAIFLPVIWIIDRFRRPSSRTPRLGREPAGDVAGNFPVGESPARNCSVPGCVGTMRFNPRQREAAGEHTLEWPWRATWVCQANPAHIEVATAAEEKALGSKRADHD